MEINLIWKFHFNKHSLNDLYTAHASQHWTMEEGLQYAAISSGQEIPSIEIEFQETRPEKGDPILKELLIKTKAILRYDRGCTYKNTRPKGWPHREGSWIRFRRSLRSDRECMHKRRLDPQGWPHREDPELHSSRGPRGTQHYQS